MVFLLPVTAFGLAITLRFFWIWAILASLVLYLSFYLAEQVWCRSVAIYPGGEKRLLSRFFVPCCVGGYGVIIAVLVLFFLIVGSMRIRGSGMMPTFRSGDLLLYHRHVFPDDLRPGHLILFRTSPNSAWGTGGDAVIGRILAVPGQELSIERDHYLVNGKSTVAVAPVGSYHLALEIPGSPQTLKVPTGSYFIVQDNPPNSFDSRVLSWAKESDLIGTRIISMNRHAFVNVHE
jgi:signal peptidase I